MFQCIATVQNAHIGINNLVLTFHFSYFHNYQTGCQKQRLFAHYCINSHKLKLVRGKEESLKLHSIVFNVQEANENQYFKHDT